MAVLTAAMIPSPTRGMNTHTSIGTTPKDHARLLVNMLPGRPGRVVIRGPLVERWTIFPTPMSINALWSSRDYVLFGSSTANTLKQLRPATGTVTTPVLAGLLLDTAHAEMGDYVYGSGTVGGVSRPIIRWSPSTSALVSYANGPANITDLCVFNNRLVVLGGIPPGGGTQDSYTLYWSDRNGPTTDTLANWQDDVSGLVNKLQFPGDDSPVALARCGQNVMICMRRSMWLLSGTADPASWTIRRAFSDYGCNNKESIVETADGFYFMSNRGYCFTNGTSVRNVSEAIQTDLQTRIGYTTNLAYAVPMDNAHIAITWSVTSTADYTYIFNMEAEAWSIFQSDYFTDHQARGTYALGYTISSVVMYDGQHAWNASYVSQPERANTSLRGTDALSVAIPDIKAITAIVDTEVVNLGAPGTTSQLHRVIVQNLFTPQAGSAAVAAGWYVTVKNGIGQTIVAEYQVGSQAVGSTPARATHVAELFQETPDAYLHIEWRSTAVAPFVPVLAAAEIHDIIIEYQASSQLSTIQPA